MAITEEQNERLTEILQALEPEIKNLGQASANFVRDQIKRHDQYGTRMFLSKKQNDWLEDLYEKYAGGIKLDHQSEDYEHDDGGEKPEIDDSVPF